MRILNILNILNFKPYWLLYWTISFKFSKSNVLRFVTNMFLYLKKLRSTSVDVIGAYLK